VEASKALGLQAVETSKALASQEEAQAVEAVEAVEASQMEAVEASKAVAYRDIHGNICPWGDLRKVNSTVSRVK